MHGLRFCFVFNISLPENWALKKKVYIKLLTKLRSRVRYRCVRWEFELCETCQTPHPLHIDQKICPLFGSSRLFDRFPALRVSYYDPHTLKHSSCVGRNVWRHKPVRLNRDLGSDEDEWPPDQRQFDPRFSFTRQTHATRVHFAQVRNDWRKKKNIYKKEKDRFSRLVRPCNRATASVFFFCIRVCFLTAQDENTRQALP